ncbi:MAG: hypothetical protein QOJ98_2006 [Acidobacteriota bacterium]|jgi:hypothetical protein|nr:hypothetical protein [Acidobacteriota bacterium]
MTPATELVECDNCDCLFAAGSVDEIFYHATARCRRDASSKAPVAMNPHPRAA